MNYNNRESSGKKRAIILVSILALVLLIGWLIYSFTSSDSKIVSFTADIPNFVVVSKTLDHIDILAVPETSKNNKPTIKIGTMELVESNAKGEQTWILAIPNSPLPVKEIVAQGYVKNGRNTKPASLPYKTSKEIASHVWPSISHPIIAGVVVSNNSQALVVALSGFTATTTVSLSPSTTIVDKQGKPSSIAKITKGTQVTILGDYIDEVHFAATQIELSK
jgi:hypothetical protein